MSRKVKHINQTPSSLERAGVRLKICGMKFQDNIEAVAALQSDYLGFIFYEKSTRFFDGEIPKLPQHIKKVGVFVNASLDYIIRKVNKYDLQAVQLHGKESPEFCVELKRHYEECQFERSREQNDVVISHKETDCHNFSQKSRNDKAIEIIKVFSIKNDFDFKVLESYEDVCDYYLFDTKGKLPGGNGYTFNWEVLKNYPSTKPYFLSGGIGLDEVESILSFLRRQESKYCYVIDVNSKFEIEPGLKEIEQLKEFITKI